MIDYRGYAYTREPSAISGGLVTHYDPTKPQIWHIPYRDTLVPKLTVSRAARRLRDPRRVRRLDGRAPLDPRHPRSSASTAPRAAAQRRSLPRDQSRVRAPNPSKATSPPNSPASGNRKARRPRWLPLRADRPTQITTRHDPARAAGRRLLRSMGLLQHRLRAEGIHGGAYVAEDVAATCSPAIPRWPPSSNKSSQPTPRSRKTRKPDSTSSTNATRRTTNS